MRAVVITEHGEPGVMEWLEVPDPVPGPGASARARTPRADCPEHGVKTIQVPWAEPQGLSSCSVSLFQRHNISDWLLP